MKTVRPYLTAKVVTENEHYVVTDETGQVRFNMKREQGLTAEGNEIGGRWVLRGADGAFVDVDRYRHDMAGRHKFGLD